MGYVGYYLLMKALGFNQTVELRLFNFVILTSGVFMGIRELRFDPKSDFNLFSAYAMGMKITAISVIPFAMLFFIYLHYSNPDFLNAINTRHDLGIDITAAFASFTVMMEGLASGFLSCYVCMQYHKAGLDGAHAKTRQNPAPAK